MNKAQLYSDYSNHYQFNSNLDVYAAATKYTKNIFCLKEMNPPCGIQRNREKFADELYFSKTYIIVMHYYLV